MLALRPVDTAVVAVLPTLVPADFRREKVDGRPHRMAWHTDLTRFMTHLRSFW
jgi:hypothetical protein